MRGKSRHIPIIFVTVINKDEHYVFKGYESGAVDSIFKPFDSYILQSKIKVFVELYQKNLKIKRQAVLMDIQMPELDGYEAAKQLRTNGYLKPIVALTAHAMKEERDRCLQVGCNDFLTKPVRRSELISALVQYRSCAAAETHLQG